MDYIRKVAVLLMALTSPLGATTEDEKENMKLKVTKESENKIDITLDNLNTQGDEESMFYQTSVFKVFMKATACTAISLYFWKLFLTDNAPSRINQRNPKAIISACAAFPFIKALATYYLLEYKITGLSRRVSIPLTYGALEAVISLITRYTYIFWNMYTEDPQAAWTYTIAIALSNFFFFLTSTLIVYLMGSGINYLWEWECRQVAEAEAKESLNLDANKNLTLEEAELD